MNMESSVSSDWSSGVWSPMLSITLVRTVSFSVYQQAKYTCDDLIYKATGRSPLVTANTRGANPDWTTVLCFGASGCIAGGAIVPIACPFELTKNAQQLSELMVNRPHAPGMNKEIAGSYQKKGTFATARQLVRNRGLMGLYSGFGYHLLRDSIGTAVYFITYETAKQLLANASGAGPTNTHAVALAGGVCGLVSWACVCPLRRILRPIIDESTVDLPHRHRKDSVPTQLFDEPERPYGACTHQIL